MVHSKKSMRERLKSHHRKRFRTVRLPKAGHVRPCKAIGRHKPFHQPCNALFINEKRKPEGLRFLRVGHPANNRYRCFLSNLAGLAAPPPPDSL